MSNEISTLTLFLIVTTRSVLLIRLEPKPLTAYADETDAIDDIKPYKDNESKF